MYDPSLFFRQEEEDSIFRHLQLSFTPSDDVDSYNDNDNGNNTYSNVESTTTSGTDGRDTYEFVAFFLWYLFLVLCCVVPTCCAYRRRRSVESRMALQQASVNRIERQNLFILGQISRQSLGLTGAGNSNEERLQEQRRVKLAEQLAGTTMTVEPHHMIGLSGDEAEAEEVCHPCTFGETDTGADADADRKHLQISKNEVDVDLQAEAMDVIDDINVNVDDINADVENPSSPNSNCNNCHALQLTVEQTTPEGDKRQTKRIVAGACAICLCPYEQGEDVTYSPKEACHHCFHSTCLLPWLARTNEPKCPCCRRDFCDPVPLSQLQHLQQHQPLDITAASTMNGSMPPIPFFFSPASFAAHMGQHHRRNIHHGGGNTSGEAEFMRTLEASQLEFMASLELAALGATTSPATAATQQQQQQQQQAHRDSYVNIHVTNNHHGMGHHGVTTLISMDGSPFDVVEEGNQASGTVESHSEVLLDGSPFEVVEQTTPNIVNVDNASHEGNVNGTDTGPSPGAATISTQRNTEVLDGSPF